MSIVDGREDGAGWNRTVVECVPYVLSILVGMERPVSGRADSLSHPLPHRKAQETKGRISTFWCTDHLALRSSAPTVGAEVVSRKQSSSLLVWWFRSMSSRSL